MGIVTGVWTYRSFLNLSDPVDDFNQLRFGQGEMVFEAAADMGMLRGQLAFRSSPVHRDDPRLTLTGSAQTGSPFSLRFQGVGVTGTKAPRWIHDYVGYLVPKWPNGLQQQPAIVGSIIRTVSREFKNPAYLSTVTLGELGALIEFSIHNDLHMRWASVPRLKDEPIPGGRSDNDIREMWDDANYDFWVNFIHRMSTRCFGDCMAGWMIELTTGFALMSLCIRGRLNRQLCKACLGFGRENGSTRMTLGPVPMKPMNHITERRITTWGKWKRSWRSCSVLRRQLEFPQSLLNVCPNSVRRPPCRGFSSTSTLPIHFTNHMETN
jgi:hypothetical protein